MQQVTIFTRITNFSCKIHRKPKPHWPNNSNLVPNSGLQQEKIATEEFPRVNKAKKIKI